MFSQGDLVRVIKDPPLNRLYKKGDVAVVDSILTAPENVSMDSWPADYWNGKSIKIAVMIKLGNQISDWTSPENLELVFSG